MRTLCIIILLKLGFILTFSFCTIAQNILIEPSGITATHPSLPYDLIVSIDNPKEGAVIYDTTFKCLRVYNGLKWECSYKNPNDLSPDKALIFTTFGIGEEDLVDFETDSLGNLYVLGKFNGTAKFGEFTKSSIGSVESKFVLKSNLDGHVFWVKTIDGQSSVMVSDLEIDKLGNVFFGGTFSNTLIFDGISILSNGEKDGFIFRLNSLGAANLGVPTNIQGNDYISQIKLDLSSNIYILGKKETSSLINPTTNEFYQDIFLQKKTFSGSDTWIVYLGGEQSEEPKSILVDKIGDIVLVGEFNETTTVGNQTLSSSGGRDFFVTKIQANGIVNWVKKGGSSINDSFVSIDVDDHNNIVLLVIKGQNNFYFDNILMNSACGSNDYLIINIQANGSYNWHKGFSGCGGQVLPINLKINRNGEYLLLTMSPIEGTSYQSLDFNKFSVLDNSLLNMYYARLNDIKGEFSQLKLSFSTNMSVIIGGTFKSSLKIGNTIKHNFGTDIFLARINEN